MYNQSNFKVDKNATTVVKRSIVTQVASTKKTVNHLF